ncbi:SURF1 family protein [Cellulomonas gelida]|uniref:SURF1 family protein n=1 Tax=Cellulomonas gelida TaxID=1712 RepID=UPI00366BA2D1
MPERPSVTASEQAQADEAPRVGTASGEAAPGASSGGWSVQEAGEPTTMLRAAVRPRMLGMLVLLAAAATVCGLLGAWQLDRAEVRGHRAQAEHEASIVAAEPVPLGDELSPQTAFRGELVARKVSVTGSYEPAGQLVVPDRVRDGATGYLVLTPLRVSDAGGASGAQAAGAVLPVVRGWVASPQDADEPPAGPVAVTGYLQASEQAGDGVQDGTVSAISSAELVGEWGGPIYTGYLVLVGSQPAQDPAIALLEPPSTPGSGLNVQNLAYAAQWWIFGGFAAALWLRMVRDEARGRPAGPGPSVPGPGAAPPARGSAARDDEAGAPDQQ